MQSKKQGLSKFKNCSPQDEYPEKCEFCQMNCGGMCVYSHEEIPDEDDEIAVDIAVSKSRKNH